MGLTYAVGELTATWARLHVQVSFRRAKLCCTYLTMISRYAKTVLRFSSTTQYDATWMIRSTRRAQHWRLPAIATTSLTRLLCFLSYLDCKSLKLSTSDLSRFVVNKTPLLLLVSSMYLSLLSFFLMAALSCSTNQVRRACKCNGPTLRVNLNVLPYVV